MRRATATLILLIAFALPLAPHVASAQSTAWPSTDGVLVFRSDRDGEPDLFTLDATTGDVTKLTDNSGLADLSPAWSPDGRRIAYVRRTGDGRPDLFVMTASGTGRQRLTHTPVPERDPSWSPDGTSIVYSARTSPRGPFRIFLAKADGSARTQLTTQARGSADRSPVFSPDGTKIAFVSDRDGGFPEIYVMSLDSSRVNRLTANVFVDGNPSWSPDGTRILAERCCANGTSDLESIDVATHAVTPITDTNTVSEFDPVMSPDGTMIAYDAFETATGNIDIWVMRADGSGATRLTSDREPDLSPDWQPVPTCTLRGTAASDDLRGTDGNDVICAVGGDDQVRAGAGDDLIFGGKGSDTLEGQEGHDVVVGDQGDDVLEGGPDYDVLDGGPGSDRCIRGADGASRRLCES